MKTAKSAAKKMTKGAKATSTPKPTKKAKVAPAVPIEATAEASLPFDASVVEPTAAEPTQPVAAPAPKNTKAKPTKKAKPTTPAKPTAKLGVLAAAHQVLSASATPMNCAELIEAMASQKLWSSPNGKTPAQTLYAAMIREIGRKGAEARFIKTERGKFEARKG